MKVEQKITKCSDCCVERIIEVSIMDENICKVCWELRRIDFEFN